MADYKRKVTISLDENIISAIDGYATENGISRSGAISVLCKIAINSFKASDSLSELVQAIRDSQPEIRNDD